MPLYESLADYSASGVYPFHMPGHKRNPKFFLDGQPLSIDVTETDATDDLHAPSGIIKEAMDFAAKVYGADLTYFLVNGSSCGIIAAVMSVCKDGDSIIAARNYHQSFAAALIYSGASPVYIMPDITDDCLQGGVNPTALAAAFAANPEAKAFYMTSPTYEGFTSDIEKISRIVHANNKVLIVDAAHGAHFTFSDYFPQDALAAGADIVIESVHKTLPAPTQVALLHTKGHGVNTPRLEQALKFSQTSSPSYMLMALTDACIRKLYQTPNIFERYIAMLKSFREQAEQLSSFKLLGAQMKGKFSIKDVDRGKLTFMLYGRLGKEAERELLREHKIQIEMAGRNHIIAMTSPADTAEGFARLITALGAMDKNINKAEETVKIKMNMPCPKLLLTPRAAWQRRTEYIKLEQSVGRISAANIVPYPPGIPLAAVGELITEQHIEFINSCKTDGIRITGLPDKNCDFVTVVK